MAITDRITRVVVLPAPCEDVWQALTQPEQLEAWFARCLALDLRPGGAALFCEDDGSLMPAVVEVVEPPHHFAFRWRFPSADPELYPDGMPSTLVEFTLETVPEGTQLILVESGFTKLPAIQRAISFSALHAWRGHLDGLVACLDLGEGQFSRRAGR